MKMNSTDQKSDSGLLSSVFPSFGLALALLGVPMGMFINLTFHFECVNLIMGLSILFIFLGRKQQFSINKGLFVILLFQILMLGYYFLSEWKSSEYLYYHYYIIVIVLLLSFTRNTMENTFVLIVIIISAILSLASVYWGIIGNVLTGGYTIDNLNMANDGTGFFLERITASHPPLVNVIAVMSNKRTYKGKIWVDTILIIIDFIALLILQKRTFIFMAILSLILLLRFKKVNIKLYKLLLWIVSFIIIGFILSTSFPNIVELFIQFLDRFVIGFKTIFGFEKVNVDDAGMGRVLGRANALNVINKFSFHNYISGYGYLSTFTDAPLIQSYIDMGILGVLLYFLAIIFYPVKTIFSKIHNESIIFAAYMSMLYVLTCLINWNPYMYHIYIPAIILYFFQSRLDGRKKENIVY